MKPVIWTFQTPEYLQEQERNRGEKDKRSPGKTEGLLRVRASPVPRLLLAIWGNGAGLLLSAHFFIALDLLQKCLFLIFNHR